MTNPGTPNRRTICFGATTIAYELSFRPRRDLAISVHPDLRVSVVSPIGADPRRVDAKVAARAPWILRQRLRYEDLHPLPEPKRFVAGETHLYLGRQYRLRILEDSVEGVELIRPFLCATVRHREDAARVRRLVEDWFRAKAEEALSRRVQGFVERNPSFRDLPHRIRLVRMSRRWGSCSPSGTVSLNPALVHVHPLCIDYVIAHELCHLKVLNHGPRFLTMINHLMPDWRRRRERLNQARC
jgi:predicted metal-dependent hydrolase